MLLVDMKLLVLSQNAQIWFFPLKLFILVHEVQEFTHSQMYASKLLLRNVQRVQT